jgi:hypothetical protein
VMIVHVHGQPVTLTPATIAATREWYAENGRACIAEARDGTTRVNDLESYVAWRKDGIAAALRGDDDHTFAFVQRAVALQTGRCVPMLAA